MAHISYIQQTDVNNYGVGSVPQTTLTRASAMIDSILHRQNGLVWMPDSNGWPCYMANTSPYMTLNFPSTSLSPGTLVTVALPPGAQMSDNYIGETVILDRANPASVEAVVVQSFNGMSSTVTFATVQNSHPAPFTVDFGMTLTEERSLPNQRSLTRLLETPVARIHSGVGRYAYGRRSDQAVGTYADVNLLSMVSVFAGPPVWQYFSVQASSFNSQTGEVWVPPGILLAYYSDIKFRYVAGWPLSALPETIKFATAQLALAIQSGSFPGNALKLKAGGNEITRAASTVLDADIMRLLSAYRAHMFT